ncbi:MAG: thioredoxin-disulfide reductase [Caldilineaceae bacterium]|nr:thioredoxin-disulfide reductase [Caldilineaceae bacterium]MDE0180631.1 thioredoxin-disulfide reductase [Caldilineaceae bacterium]
MSEAQQNGSQMPGGAGAAKDGSGPEEKLHDVIVIGSGPAGWTAGLYAARANLEPLLITGDDYGGQVSITYEVENYPGFPEGLSGPDLVEKFKAQAERFGCTVSYDHVTEIVVDEHPFTVRTAQSKEYKTKSLILCTGARPRFLEVPGEQEYTGKGVSYCATCDGFFFRGKELVVVGGGDSALEEGLFLTKFATNVRIIHRRDELRASKILQDRAFAHDKIDFVWNTVVTSISGNENGVVSGVTTQDTLNGSQSHIDTDGVFVYIGHIPNNELYHGKLDLDEDGHLIADPMTRTNIPGVFAAGEIADKVFKQVATSVGQGCAAAMQAEKFLASLEAVGLPDLNEDPRAWPVPGVPERAPELMAAD